MMFGPNRIPSFHHRSPQYRALQGRVEQLLRERFNIGPDYGLYFMTGSGTLALEACIASARRPVTPIMFTHGKFEKRLADFTFVHNKHGIGTEDVAFVHYETSKSILNQSGWKAKGITIVDCISSFPYYPIPFDADVFVTVTGKQLGGVPGIAIIGIHKRCWEYVNGEAFYDCANDHESYLNLALWRNAKVRGETPFTPAISVMTSLLWQLERRDYAMQGKKIRSRWDALVALCGGGKEIDPPVYTFPGLLSCHEYYKLYGKEQTQLFLWAGTDASFQILLNRIKGDLNEGTCPRFGRA